MYREYFVLVTEQYYGVFEISANDYPRIFKNNVECVKCIEESQIEDYLFKKVGNNSLAKHNFKWYQCVGHVCCR